MHIELQHRKPPMGDEALLRFCDWLNDQMPLVVQNFPYVRKSGAYVDLSDNQIGTEGLDKLFRVLRDHRVPCVVMKAYRNGLDDGIVDTIIEYLYTQPEAFPMHGIHISHNNITDKGAFRLIRAAAQCGHYPRLTSRLPLWLRLEAMCGCIENPHKIIAESKEEGFNVCLMKDGLCSRPDCNHYSGVHVQLPYFLNQPPKGSFNRWTQQRPEAPAGVPRPTAAPAPYSKAPSAAFQQAPGPNMQAQYFAGTGSACGSSMPPSGLFGKAAGAPPPISQPNWGGVWPNDGSGGQSQGGWQDNAGWGGKGGWGQQGGGGWKGGNGGWNGGGGGWNGGGGGWNGSGDGGGKGGGGKKGGGKGGHQMWQGTALVHKARKDVKVSEGSSDLGFQWRYLGEGQPPQVILVNPITSVGQIAQAGDYLLRLNGLDMTMMSEKQVTDLLKQRPLELRFGDL
ncbi:unnamed protein product [Polarella glacialis]|uniref:PDZ domain-containing protein n=2 Tax=Polarella glacialis TaxID=89957 RepID=A0A813FGT7_POLGL|nr:unnamed protein product [Polarella glacialis]